MLQLEAQFRAIFKEILRQYCENYPHLSESEIANMMEAYPSYGLVTIADVAWVLVRYTSAGVQWQLEKSPNLRMTLAMGRRPKKAQLAEQIGDILGYLAGMVTAAMSDAVTLETQLTRANSASMAASST